MAFTKIAAAGIGSTGTVTLENVVVTGSLNASSITGAASTATVSSDSLNVSGVTTTTRLNVGTGGTIITTTSGSFVGIGTTNPSEKLTVFGTGINRILVQNPATTPGNFSVYDWKAGSTNHWSAYVPSPTNIWRLFDNSFGLLNDDGLRIECDPNGNVGILTSSVAGSTLNVRGRLNVSGISTYTGTIFGSNASLTGLSTFSGGIQVGATTSITVGQSFIRNNAVGLGTTSTTGRNAGVSTAQGTLIFNSDTGTVQVYNGNAWRDVGKEAINATGGFINEYVEGNKVYRSHIFTNSGFFSVSSAPPTAFIETIAVAGGGAGGGDGGSSHRLGGGGGAGGLVYYSSLPIASTPGSYTITVGAGGAIARQNGPGQGATGNDTTVSGPTITTISAKGGGGGGPGDAANAGASGGSGGGGGRSPAGGTATQPGTSNPGSTTNAGFPGGGGLPSTANPQTCGGGGGAAAAGFNNIQGISSPGGYPSANGTGVPAGNAGKGGNGLPFSISGVTTHYAGGGGAGFHGPYTPEIRISGGLGGGGAGGLSASNDPGLNGTVATGGGGGGGSTFGPPVGGFGGQGGSGIVIVRYEIGQVGGTAKATGGAISYTPTTTVHTFYNSGIFTVTNPGLTNVDCLIVGGGGGGGGESGGGGGAGALKYFNTRVDAGPGAFTVTVGAGGAGLRTPVATGLGNDGSASSVEWPSTFSGTQTAPGGGGGGGWPSANGNPGGSGGGAGGVGTSGTGGTAAGNNGGTPNAVSPAPTLGWGNPGGSSVGTSSPLVRGGGGGGGAGASGTNASAPVGGGPGGTGLAYSISGTMTYYAGGGGGGSEFKTPGTPTTSATLGGAGGGGIGGFGGSSPQNAGSNGSASTGGGGGGSAGNTQNSGSGGSGIVIIAYPS